MTTPHDPIEQLNTLNQIANALNRATDVRGALQSTLEQLIDLMGLQTGWIFLHDPAKTDSWRGRGFVLAAHTNLPPALALRNTAAWDGACECQGLCTAGKLTGAYNEVRCTRLASGGGDRRGLAVHASTPLVSGDRVLGILNVAAPDWDSFHPAVLALLTNVGSQMGIALERARLYDLLHERRILEQTVLLELSNQMLCYQNLDELMQYLVKETRRLLNADASALLLCAGEARDLAVQSASGWDHDPVAAGRVVPNDGRNLPSMALETRRPILVADIQDGSLPLRLPGWFQAEGFRGHAAAPLLMDEVPIGVLLVNTRQPRLPTEDDVHFLRLLANQAAIAIETTRLRDEEIRQHRLEEELAIGQRIQRTLLPRGCPVVPGWDFAAVYRSARQVGGDFYDFFALPGEPARWGFVIADVADKGVPAALYMALCRTMIRTMAMGGRGAAEALQRANDLILNDSWAEMFVSVFYAILEPASGHLTYVNAGHNRPLWASTADGRVHELAAKGRILGILPDVVLEERAIDLAPGDVLVLYTDGVTEAMDPAYQEFGEARLREVIQANANSSAQAALEAITGAVHHFMGEAMPADDLTVVIVRRQISAPASPA